MNLTGTQLESMYCCLAACPPFSKLKLPPVERIDFDVSRSRMLMGSYDGDPHTISVSKTICTTIQEAFETVAHEMVHLALERAGSRNHADHDSDFNALAAKVCDAWGWDFKEF